MYSYIQKSRVGKKITVPSQRIEDIILSIIRRTALMEEQEVLFTDTGSAVPRLRQKILNRETVNVALIDLVKRLKAQPLIQNAKVIEYEILGEVLDLSLEIETTTGVTVNTNLTI